MKRIQSLCVFCGSRSGADPVFGEAAEQLGRLLAQRGVRLIYGGGSIGLMGIVMRAVLENGGEVCGVIPEFLTRREVGNPDLTEIVVVGFGIEHGGEHEAGHQRPHHRRTASTTEPSASWNRRK